MRNFEKIFSFSIADEIAPDILNAKDKKNASKFALILSNGETISATEIKNVQYRTGLIPLFFLARTNEFTVSRSYARSLGASVIRPRTNIEFARAMKECEFAISEELSGAVFSLLSHTPTYINAGNAECRRFISEVVKWNVASEIIIPYTKNRTAIIRRPNVSDSDFYYAINKFRAYIDAKFHNIFN